jgi:hypothetical protein
LPAGHPPAMAAELVATEPAIIPASARPCQIVRDATLDVDMLCSSVFCLCLEIRLGLERSGRLHHHHQGNRAREEMPVGS